MNISPFLSVDQTCGEVLQRVKALLSAAGLRPVQTFDLHAAQLGLRDCPCPNHGTEECDCQMVILLVYGSAPGPATLILHGSHGQAWLSVADDPHAGMDADLTEAIRQALR
jgi:hypothetical protein